MKRRAIAVSLVGGLALVGGAAAAAGALPGAASPTAGEHVSDAETTGTPNEHAGTHPDTRGQSADASAHGTEVSELAKTTTAVGVDKGAEVSALASGGKSHAGDNGA